MPSTAKSTLLHQISTNDRTQLYEVSAADGTLLHQLSTADDKLFISHSEYFQMQLNHDNNNLLNGNMNNTQISCTMHHL